MPYLPPAFRPIETREFYLQPTNCHLEPFEVLFEAVQLEHAGEKVGYLLIARLQGRAMELGHFGADTIPELVAYTWLCNYQPPEPERPPRRGLLWHLISAARRWHGEGY